MKKGLAVILALTVTGILIWTVIIPVIAQDGSTVDIPTEISYQGYLENDDNPVNASGVQMQFALYETFSGGSPIWTEIQSVDVSEGLFNVLLGSGSPMAASDFDGDRFLGISVAGDSEMTPRQKMVSVAYAFQSEHANTANKLGVLNSSDLMRQDIQDFVVASGESVTAGDVVAFVDGFVEKCSPSGIPIGGAESVFNSSGTQWINAAALTDTKFVVAYKDLGNSDFGTAIIGDISGAVISYGSEYPFNLDDSWYISVAALSESSFVVAYRDDGDFDYGKAIIGNVSGTDISYGSEYRFNSDRTQWINAAALTDTKFVVAYMDDDNSDFGTAIIGDISGAVISYGSEYPFNLEYTDDIFVAALTDTKFVVAYRDSGNSGFGTAIIGDISDATISYGSEYVFHNGSTANISVEALTDTRFVVAYSDSGTDDNGNANIGDVFGNTISCGLEYVFDSNGAQSPSVFALSETNFVVAYRDMGNGQFGTVIVPEYEPVGEILGIAKESKSLGQSVPVIISGVSDVHTGLIPGAHYYCASTEDLTTNVTSYGMGFAVSSTELLLDIERGLWD